MSYLRLTRGVQPTRTAKLPADKRLDAFDREMEHDVHVFSLNIRSAGK